MNKELKREIHQIICELGADPNICAVIGSWLDDIYSDEEALRDLKSFRQDSFKVIVKNDDYDKLKSEQNKKKLN